ncbi:MAG: metallophosphoesterase [Acidobacteria bacterium]|nr:metallophosphoesterase [Acidobacteriota bacterium]
MGFIRSLGLEILLLFAVLWAQRKLRNWALAGEEEPRRRRAIHLLWGAFALLNMACILLSLTQTGFHTRVPALIWLRGLALALAIFQAAAFLLVVLFRRLPAFNPERRQALRIVQAAIIAAPAAVVGFGIVRRNDFTLKQVDLHVPGLPRDLDGLRIAQITDVHLSAYFSEKDLERAVDMANETRPDLTVVTGDLITRVRDPLDTAIRHISRLRAASGVWGCHGNHEIYAGCEEYATRQAARAGVRYLRGQAVALRFGAATLNLSGVDYQPQARGYLAGGGAWVLPEAYNILLSHNPDVFPVAVGHGFDLILSGHTHGGQVNVEILDRHISPVRFFTPFVYGVYQENRSRMYVSRGLGTVGVPARIGAPPEVPLIRLCAT